MSLITLCHSLCDPLGNWNFSCSAVFLGCSAAFFLPHFQVLHPRGCGPVFPILAKGAWKAPKTRANFHFSTDTHTYVRTHTHNWESVFPPLFRWWFEFVTFRLIAARFLLCFSFIHSSFSINLRIHNLNNFPSRTQTHAHTHTETLGKGESETALTATERCDWNGISDCFGLYGFRPRSRTPWWNNNWVLNLRQECSICHSKKRRHLLHEQRDCERERARERAASARKREPILSYTIWCWLMPYSDSASGRANVASEPVLTLWHGFPTTTDRTAENPENSGECSALETNAV